MRNGVVPEHWTDFYESTHIPAAVRDGNRLYVTGHTGEDSDGNFSADPGMQIRQTFRHISATLSKGGASWADVVELNSYHVGLQAQGEVLIAIAGEFLHDPYPAWTAVGVTELFDKGAVVEISCVAAVSSRKIRV
jgi:enamine deaminase RidA (YjgF/YER057c/UK114 family)